MLIEFYPLYYNFISSYELLFHVFLYLYFHLAPYSIYGNSPLLSCFQKRNDSFPHPQDLLKKNQERYMRMEQDNKKIRGQSPTPKFPNLNITYL